MGRRPPALRPQARRPPSRSGGSASRAAELLRVCKPGARIGLAIWAPDGFTGSMFQDGRRTRAAAGIETTRREYTFRCRSTAWAALDDVGEASLREQLVGLAESADRRTDGPLAVPSAYSRSSSPVSVRAVIGGRCDPRFAAVRRAFEANFADHGELGASCTVLVDGELVVDLWGGWADPGRTRPWQPDTLCNAYSVGKAVVATLLLQLVDDGLVDLDEPVAAYWPAFAAAGKERATVRHALSHRAGVPAIRERLTNDDLWDFDRMCAALAATAPWWTPGERHAYHTNTFGHLVGGIVRQVTGRLPGDVLRGVAAAVGADVHVGLPDAEHARCADIDWAGPASAGPADASALEALDDDTRMTLTGYANPPGYSSMGVVNTAEWRRAQVPSTNGQMSARGIARWYEGLRRGDLLSPSLLREAVRPQASGWCPTLGQDVTFALGFQPWTPARPIGRTPTGFGHFGTGGSLGFADPSVGVAFGYVMNHVIPRWQSPRNRALVDAVYASL